LSMQRELRKLLFDLKTAAELIIQFTKSRSISEYKADIIIKSAVERQFEIIGEAMIRLHRLEPQVVNSISEYRRIINFRNALIHGYDAIDDDILWDILQTDLPVLLTEVTQMLNQN
jgi:uncharacterized protein with HEPN domain